MNSNISERSSDCGIFPKVVLIDTVSFCNLKCSMCVHKKMKRNKGIMPWGIFTKIIDEISSIDKKTRVWMVFFGEPLLLKKKKPSIFDMIAYAKSKGLKDVVLNTNATLLDKKSALDLIISGLDGIYIGIDAFDPDTYAKIRVGGNYKKTIKNILALLKMQKTMKKDKPKVFVQFVEMPLNMKEEKDFINFWKKQKVAVKIRPKVSWAGSVEAPNLLLGNKDRWPCYWAMQTMAITDTGDAVMCAVDLDAMFVAGNIKSNTLRQIWNGRLKELRDFHSKGEFSKLPSFCRDCRDWQSARADYY